LDVTDQTMNQPARKNNVGGASAPGLLHSLGLAAIILANLIVTADAHIGSPNVAFNGQAGPNAVRVVIRPPPTLPGLARVSVRAEGAKNVAVQLTVERLSTAGAPPIVRAQPVAGSNSLFQADVWLWHFGPCVARVTVESDRGSGTAVVPVNSAVTKQPAMPRGLEISLLLLGCLLFVAAVIIAGAVARESCLSRDATLTQKDWRRGRIVAGLAVFFLATGIAGGAWRWRTMDREFRNNALARPEPVAATITRNDTFDLLRLEPSPQQTLPGWDTLMADHGKLMHLFLISDPDANTFAHLHPVRRSARSFETLVPEIPAGKYQLYAELTREDGSNQTLVARVQLPPSHGAVPQPGPPDDTWCKSPPLISTDAPRPTSLDRDDSWSTAATGNDPRVSELPGGNRMVLENAGNFVANRDASLRFVVFNSLGERVTLRPYMGMLGHCVVRRKDGSVFAHLHPTGTISMAMEEKLTARENAAISPTPPPTGREVIFPYAFPRAGEYRLWAQVCTGGRVLTGVFDVDVNE
jgi:hypothetical protein